MGITQDWQRVERWLTAHASDVFARLPPAASKSALDEANVALGFALPPELLESLAIHDGNDDSFSLYRSDNVPLGTLLPLRQIVERWRSLVAMFGDGGNDEVARPPKGIKRRWFHRHWVPILDGLGDHACIDLDPAPGGKREQVIKWVHDAGPLAVVAASYTDLFTTFARDLEEGRYVQAHRHGQAFLNRLK